METVARSSIGQKWAICSGEGGSFIDLPRLEGLRTCGSRSGIDRRLDGDRMSRKQRNRSGARLRTTPIETTAGRPVGADSVDVLIIEDAPVHEESP